MSIGIDGWSLVRFAHVLAATVWVGGQLLLSIVIVPSVRARVEPPAQGELIVAVGRRFGILTTVVLLPVLVASGIALAWHRGVTFDSFSLPGYGQLLGTKIGLVVVVVALAAGHGAVARAGHRTLGRWLAIASLVTSVVIVLIATALVP